MCESGLCTHGRVHVCPLLSVCMSLGFARRALHTELFVVLASAAVHNMLRLPGRRVSKRYRALVCGRLEGDGWVDFPLEGGRLAALTRYAAVGHSSSGDGWLTTVDLWPHTGARMLGSDKP